MVMMSNNIQELRDMFEQQEVAAERVGLKMNLTKTTIMSNNGGDTEINGTTLENAGE